MKFLFVILISLSALFASTSSFAEDCKTHKIYCRILKLNPKIDKSRAFRLSNLIYVESQKTGVDPMISVAILMQESAFRSENRFHIETKTERYCDQKGCYEKIIKDKTVSDMGIAQINIGTAKFYKLDFERLFNLDTEYAIECHFLILKDKMSLCDHLGDDSWTCYHSTTEEHRLTYKRLVSRYLPKVEK